MRHANANCQHSFKLLGNGSNFIGCRFISDVIKGNPGYFSFFVFCCFNYLVTGKLIDATLANVSSARLNVTLLTASIGRLSAFSAMFYGKVCVNFDDLTN